METALNLSPEIESQALALPERARLISVIDNESMEQANQFKLDIRDMIKSIDDFFKPMADKAFQAHRAVTARWNETKAPLKEADDHVTRQVKDYLAELRRKEEEEAARLREEARKEEEERRLAQAAELEKEGNIDEANAILEEPLTYVAPAPVKVIVPKVDNRLYRTTLKVRVADRARFLAHFGLTPVNQVALIELMTDKGWEGIEANLTRKAKALGKAFQMPGCQLIEQ